MIAAAIIVALFIIVLLKIFSAAYSHLAFRIKMLSVPGPYTVPFIGSFVLVLFLTKEELFRLMWKQGERYKNGMYLLWFGTNPMLTIAKPHQIEVILKSSTLIKKSQIYNYLSDWLGNGLISSTGEVWHRHRRLLTPAFHFGVLDQFSEIIFNKVTILNDFIKLLVDEDPNRPINIFPMAVKFALDASLNTIMGLDFDVQRKSENKYVEALHRFTEIATDRFFSFWLWPDFIFYRTSKGKQFRHSATTLHDFTKKIIDEKIKMRRESAVAVAKTTETEESNYNNLTPFLDLLIDLSEADENPLSLEELREEVDTFMFAAHDTTGIALSYTLFCLGHYPKVQQNIYDEIQEILPNAHKVPTKQQLVQLKYLERVVKESLRLFPSAPFIVRELTHDVEIDGYLIPKGVEVHIPMMQMHWNPEIWPNPTNFDPDRFLPENSVGRHPYSYLPFSAGPRNCIGQKYAMMLLKIALAKILREWIVYTDVPIPKLKYSTRFMLTPPNKTINLQFERRH